MRIKPKDILKNYFAKLDYPILANYSNHQSYLTLNDENVITYVRAKYFDLIDSNSTVELIQDEIDVHVELPEIWLKKNRELLPNVYWNIGGQNLYERIKTAKSILELGLELSKTDELLITNERFQFELFKESLKWYDNFNDILSDKRTTPFIGCFLWEEIKQEDFFSKFEWFFIKQHDQIDYHSTWKNKIEIINLKSQLMECLNWHFDWLTPMTHFPEVFIKRKGDFQRLKDIILLNFLTLIEDWDYNCFELQYYYAGCDYRTIVIQEENNKTLILNFGNTID
jgi:hypothetical protein